MAEQFLLVLTQQVVTGIKLVRFRQAEVSPEQVRQSRSVRRCERAKFFQLGLLRVQLVNKRLVLIVRSAFTIMPMPRDLKGEVAVSEHEGERQNSPRVGAPAKHERDNSKDDREGDLDGSQADRSDIASRTARRRNNILARNRQQHRHRSQAHGCAFIINGALCVEPAAVVNNACSPFMPRR